LLQRIAIRFKGKPTAPVIGRAAVTNKKSWILSAAHAGAAWSSLKISADAFLTGWLSDQFAGQFGPSSLRWSMGVMSLMSVWAAFHYWAASNHMDRRPAKG
jgi:hypothetical protein